MFNEDKYEWDESKRLENLRKHGVDFTEIYAFNWDTAWTESDNRFFHDEARFIAFGLIHWRVYRISYTYRGEQIRLINLRKAEKQEVRHYVRQI
jgi:uncharacterized DUF497 family protein